MTTPRTPLIAGNWKMNGLRAALAELDAIAEVLAGGSGLADALICPPATLIAAAAARVRGRLAIGGQDCHMADAGAHTGDVSAQMLADAGARAVIVGHSERRADHGETDDIVRAKAEAALSAGLTAIVCVGESEAQRDAGDALGVITRQLAGSAPSAATARTLIVAYEPVWAIGSGRTPTTADIAEAHAALRAALAERIGAEGEAVRILYGGSVKPANAREILATADVDGALVGGASLKAADFLAIYAAAG